MDAPFLLEAEGISWAPPGAQAPLFEGVCLGVAPAERVVLMGASGSGKSTLLRCLVGLEPRRAGVVSWRGAVVDAASMRRFRSRAAYVHQRPSKVAETVGENLAFARRMGRELGPPEPGEGTEPLDEDAQRELCARLGLKGLQWSRRFDDLSVGEQQRLCLVRALTGAPDMLLLDEPTSALDPGRVGQIEALLLDYVAAAPQRRALLWVSHDPNQVERIATRRLEMSLWTEENA